jgi:single-strand DNA-binding protein
MGNVNKVVLIGRLGKDPEMFQLEAAKKVSFSLATTEYYYDREKQKREITEWHNIVMWRGLAEIAEKYLNKGDLIYVEGKIRTRSWEDKETKQKRYMVEIQADQMQMLSTARNNQNNGANSSVTLQEVAVDDDGLPF